MFCSQRSVKRQNDGWKWTQMHPTWKYCWMNQKMLDEKFDREQTLSNIIQHGFFLLFYFFLNFKSSQMYPTFHPTSKIFDVRWNVGCICAGLKEILQTKWKEISRCKETFSYKNNMIPDKINNLVSTAFSFCIIRCYQVIKSENGSRDEVSR